MQEMGLITEPEGAAILGSAWSSVMEKAGMKQKGILRQAGKNNQGVCDEVWHAIIRSDREQR